MLFYWAMLALRKIVWLFRAPKQQEISRIDPDTRCPVCGGQSGKLRCVQTTDQPVPEEGQLESKFYFILCRHLCNICGAMWFEKPVLKNVNVTTVLPSVARDDIESREDRRLVPK